MPITPFHFGPGALFKCAAPGHLSWTVFALANMLIDLEPITLFFVTGDPTHPWLHTPPGAIDYATNGICGTHHLAWERLQRAAGITLHHIPFKSAAPALQEVLAGRVSMMLIGVSTAFPHIKDGRLVSLATGGLARSPFLPNLPTLAESGFPGFEVVAWMAVMAPKGMPPALLDKISRDINKVTLSKAYHDSLAQRGSEPRTSTPKELAERIHREYESTRTLIKSLGIKSN